MKVVFRESDHTYWLGKKQLISVTSLLRKHGLSTDYTGIDPDVLRMAADKGKAVHKEIEDYIKNSEAGFTSELLDCIDIAAELGFVADDSEVILPCRDIPDNEADNYFFAGTADLVGFIGKSVVLVDIKTTAKADKKACAWQLSLYERLYGAQFDRLYMFHLGENSKAIRLERIPAEEIDRLLECERNGEIYQERGLVIASDLLARAQQAEQILKQAEAEKNAAEATAKEYRQMLYEAMGAQKIASWETLDKSMLITRIEPSTYEDKNGNKRTVYEIMADDIEFLTPKEKDDYKEKYNYYDEPPAPKAQQTQMNQVRPKPNLTPIDDDDLPF
jgi:hypothetical protein